MAFLDETGFCRKNNFSSSEKLFFSHTLGLLPIHSTSIYYMWIELGNRNLVPPNNLEKNLATLAYGMKSGFAEKQFFKLRNITFSRMLGLLPIHPKSICR